MLWNKEYKNFKSIKVNNIQIEKSNKNILIKNKFNTYLIKLSNEKFTRNYDIIDCKHSNYVKIVLLNNEILVTN